MIGGTQNVILGDIDAAGTTSGALCKVVKERAGAPTFDAIVALQHGCNNNCKVILDSAAAVDTILQGK
jgi:single-stranded DNA-specific DHH superfamily exonuclease